MSLFKNILQRLIPNSTASSPNLTEQLASQVVEAASTEVKKNKLEAAKAAVFLGQLNQMAQDEIKDVRQLKKKHLGHSYGEDDMNNIIVCDDYHNNDVSQQPTSVLAEILRGVVLGLGVSGLIGLGAGAMGLYLATKVPEVKQEIKQDVKPQEFTLEIVPIDNIKK